MYAIILVVCLASLENRCVAYTEDPPRYYETLEQCQNQMAIRAQEALVVLEARKQQGHMTGKCIYVDNVKPA